MKKIMAVLAVIFVSYTAAWAQWLPVSVNTNTWACKPTGDFTNYWNNIGTIATTPTTPTTPTSSPPISVSSPYYTAELWYDFVADNGTGTNIIDATDNGKDGYEVTALTIEYNQPEWTDYYVSFDDTAQTGIKTTSATLLNGASRLSVAMWIRLDANVEVADNSYLFLGHTAGSYNLRSAHVNTWAANTFSVLDGIDVGSTPDFVLPLSEWVHLAVTRELGETMIVYTNAVVASSDAVAASAPVIVGSWQIGGIADERFINASMDDFALWSKILTPANISNIVVNGRSTNAVWYSDSVW